MKLSLVLVLAFGAYAQAQLGGKRDSKGCIPSAGFIWCEAYAKCVQPFETPCPQKAMTTNSNLRNTNSNLRTTTRYIRPVTTRLETRIPVTHGHGQHNDISKKCHDQCAKVCQIVHGDGSVLGNEDVCQHCHQSCGKSNSTIPLDCQIWFDGCNKCRVQNGKLIACTKMMCTTKSQGKCLQFGGNTSGDKATKRPHNKPTHKPWPTRKPYYPTKPQVLDGKMWG